MKNKKLIVIAAAALVVILAVLLFLWPGFLLKKPAGDDAPAEMPPAGGNGAPGATATPAPTPAPDPVVSGDFEYIPTGSGTAKITRFVGEPSGTIEIPEALDGLKVTALAETAFEYSNFRTYEIVIPNTLTQIDANPFAGCDRLKRIILEADHPTLTFSDGLLINKVEQRVVAGMWDGYFSNDISVSIPDGVKVIGSAAFARQSAGYVTIPDSVTTIEDDAFADCSLKTLRIGAGVTGFGTGVLSGCSHLATIEISPENHALEVKDGVLFSTNDHRLLFVTAGKTDETYEIPEGTKSIDARSFGNYGPLVNVVIPDSVTTVGENPFIDCDHLAEIRLSENHPALTVADGALISKADHRLVCYPQGRASGTCTVPGDVAVIGDYAFSSCKNLTGIVISDGVKEIGRNAFWFCLKLETAALADSITQIGKDAFADCTKLRSINLPAGQLKEIGTGTFSGCSVLTDVVIPEGVQVIGKNAFRNCTKLQTVTVPASVTSIAVGAFDKESSMYTRPAELTFRVPAGSYAETWCRENGKPFEAIQ